MNTDKIDQSIPDQQTGSKTDTHHTKTAKGNEEGKELFATAKNRLQDVNNWNRICGEPSAVFRLTDADGNEVARLPQKGDHFKIDLPAPGSEAGEGNDWVCIEAIDDQSNPDGECESFVIRVRPSSNPQKPQEGVAHFFKEDATSSFAVQREKNKITASVHGRNEVPNTESESILDKARNAIVAVGAMIGISNPQWKSLVKGLLED